MVTRQAIYDEVLRVLRQELLFSGEVDPGTSIRALGLDSLQFMQLFVYLEEAFSFEFTEDSLLTRMKEASLGQLVDCVDRSLQAPR